MHRSVDAPEQVYSSAKEAAAWLGLSDSAFRREAAERSDLLPAVAFGGGNKWYWMDLVVYAWWRRHRGGSLPAEENEGEE